MEMCHGSQLPERGECMTCQRPGPGRAAEIARRAASSVGVPSAHDDIPPPEDPSFERGARRLHVAGDSDDDDNDMTLDAIPIYPVDKLIGPLRDYVEWAIRDGLPAASAGAAALAALATVTARAELALTSTLNIRPVLWIPIVGGTGTGKSGAIDQAFKEITDLYDDERAAWDSECSTLQGKPKAEFPPPPPPQPITLGDVTLPSAARWLQGNGGTGCLVFDELMTLLMSCAPADRAKLCEAWTARRPMHIQRVGDGGGKNAIDIYVSKPVLSIVGPLTPDDTKELGREGDGFRARWLPHLTAEQAEHLDGGPHPDTWINAITSLYRQRGPRRWELTGRARTAYEKARQRWLAEQKEPHPQMVVEALRKADAQCARIALVIAESCEHNPKQYASSDRGGISLDAIKAAIALTDYVMDCWKALPGSRVLTLSMADEKLSDAAQELFGWLENRPKGTEGLAEGSEPRARAARRDIQRARVGGAVTEMALISMLHAYDARWPGNIVSIPQGGKGGGRPRVFCYFPKRAANKTADTPIDVTVTSIGASTHLESSDESAGQKDGLVTDRCHRSMSQIDVTGSAVTSIRAETPPVSDEPGADSEGRATDRAATVTGLHDVGCTECGAVLRTIVEPGESAYCNKCGTEFVA